MIGGLGTYLMWTFQGLVILLGFLYFAVSLIFMAQAVWAALRHTFRRK